MSKLVWCSVSQHKISKDENKQQFKITGHMHVDHECIDVLQKRL